jgi:hypothetical protein
MNKQRGTLVAFLAAAAWPLIAAYFWEFIREFVVYEQASRLLHTAIEKIPADAFGRLAPSLIFFSIGSFLLLREHLRPTTVAKDCLALASRIHDSRQWFSSFRMLELIDADRRASPREALYEGLRTGKLVATGFLHPIHHHAEEIEIPPTQWRTIRFNRDFTEARGRSIRYTGIAVARASS